MLLKDFSYVIETMQQREAMLADQLGVIDSDVVFIDVFDTDDQDFTGQLFPKHTGYLHLQAKDIQPDMRDADGKVAIFLLAAVSMPEDGLEYLAGKAKELDAYVNMLENLKTKIVYINSGAFDGSYNPLLHFINFQLANLHGELAALYHQKERIIYLSPGYEYLDQYHGDASLCVANAKNLALYLAQQAQKQGEALIQLRMGESQLATQFRIQDDIAAYRTVLQRRLTREDEHVFDWMLGFVQHEAIPWAEQELATRLGQNLLGVLDLEDAERDNPEFEDPDFQNPDWVYGTDHDPWD